MTMTAMRGSCVVALAALLGGASAQTLVANENLRACVCAGEFDASVDLFPNKVEPDFATTWDVEYFNHYKKLTIGENVYVLNQCGTPAPQLKEGETLVTIPVRTAGISSTGDAPFFEFTAQRSSLAWFSGKGDHMTSPCLLKQVADGETATADESEVEPELDVMFLSPFSTPTGTNPEVVLDIVNEKNALGKAEYTEVISLFFNREEAAAAVVENIEARYQCNKKQVEQLEAADKTKILYFFPFSTSNKTKCGTDEAVTVYGSGITSSGEPGTDLAILMDAGAEAIPLGDKDKFYLSSRQEVLDKAAQADVIVVQADLSEAALGKTTCSEDMTAFVQQLKDANKPIYDIYMTSSAGGSDFFQGKDAEPDVLLLDAIAIFNPDVLTQEHTRQYLRQIAPNAETGTTVTAEQCTNPDEPLFSDWQATACADDTAVAVIPGTAQLKAADVCDKTDPPATIGDSAAPHAALPLLSATAVAAFALV